MSPKAIQKQAGKAQPAQKSGVKSGSKQEAVGQKKKPNKKKNKKQRTKNSDADDLNRAPGGSGGKPTEQSNSGSSGKGKGQSPDLSFDGAQDLHSPQAGPSRAPMDTSMPFTPLGRSILAGMDRTVFSPNRSPSPPAETADESNDIIIDTEPSTEAAQISEHFNPPPLFSATLDTAVESALAAKKAEAEPADPDASSNGLLLPSHVLLDGTGVDGGEQSENRPGEQLMEGLHFVDDSTTKGVQRYFIPEDEEEDSFLANADSRQICSKCKRPGHRQWECPHVIVSGFIPSPIIFAHNSALCAVQRTSTIDETVHTVWSALGVGSEVIDKA